MEQDRDGYVLTGGNKYFYPNLCEGVWLERHFKNKRKIFRTYGVKQIIYII